MIRLGVVLFALAVAGGACAYRQTHLDTIDQADRQRFAACREDVVRRLCGYDTACAARVPTMYLAEQPRGRRQWLLYYGCPPSTLRRAEQPK